MIRVSRPRGVAASDVGDGGAVIGSVLAQSGRLANGRAAGATSGEEGNVVSARVIMDVSARVIKLGYAND